MNRENPVTVEGDVAQQKKFLSNRQW